MTRFIVEINTVFRRLVSAGYSLVPFLVCFLCVSIFLFLTFSIIQEYSFREAADLYNKDLYFIHYRQ